MKRWLSMTRRTASSTSLRISAYCALRSSSGTVMAVFAGGAAFAGVAVFVGAGHMVRSPWMVQTRRTLGVHPALVLEPLFLGDRLPRLGRRAPDDGARAHVAGHHRAGGDQAILPDRDAGQQHRARPDSAALADGHTLEVLEALGGAPDVVVVRRDHARGHEHPVLERRIHRDVTLALELAVAAHGAELLDRHA